MSHAAASACVVSVLVGGAGHRRRARRHARRRTSGICPRTFRGLACPADNPMSDAKVELGRHLFYDTRLSGNGTQSCATCHEQARAFTDGKGRAVGSTGQVHPRGSMSLVNVAYAAALTWGNPTMTRLEDQALVPMFGEQPVELGLQQPGTELLDRLRGEPRYRPLFERAFGDEPDPFTIEHVTQALAVVRAHDHLRVVALRSLSQRARRRRDLAGGAARRDAVLQPAAVVLPLPRRLHVLGRGGLRRAPRAGEVEFHNTGLYNLAGALSYPAPTPASTRSPGSPRTSASSRRRRCATSPSPRRTCTTAAPRRSRTSIAHYAAGGRTIADGPNRGVGHDNPGKSPTVRGFPLSAGAARRSDRVSAVADRRSRCCTIRDSPIRGRPVVVH